MKRLIIAISAAVLALPLCAQNVLSVASAPEATDSPLVRAAKLARKNSAGKKAPVVITNDTLATTGGHMATAGSDVAALPKTTGTGSTEADLRNARAEKETTARREAAAARLQRLKNDPEGFFRDDAADRNGTTMSTTQVSVTSATQVSTTTATQPGAATTAAPSPYQVTTSQPAAMKPAQPETANTVTPPRP